jgi:hypothetical protein
MFTSASARVITFCSPNCWSNTKWSTLMPWSWAASSISTETVVSGMHGNGMLCTTLSKPARA